MFLLRILLRTKTISSCPCKCYSKTPKNSVNKLHGYINQTWSRSTSSKFISKETENTFALGIVKKAGIAEITEKPDFPIIDQIVSGNGSQQVLDDFTIEIQKFSDMEMVALLDRLPALRNEDFFDKLWKIIDLEGSKRVPFGSPSVVLAGAMKIVELRLNFMSEWIWSCLKRFCRRLDRLTKAEMLQVMFLVNINRRIPQQYSGFDVQHHLVRHFDDLSIEEMSLVAVAFFKSQKKMHNKVIMGKIMRKVIEDASSCPGIGLAMISKTIRYSLPITLADELYVMQCRLVEEIPRIEPKSLTHLALSGTSVLIYNQKFIQCIVDRMKTEISNIRLKDMERILHVMSLFNHKDDAFVKIVLNELNHREDEIKEFPRPLFCLINFLSILEHYPIEWIDRVLSEKFLSEAYPSYRKTGTELVFLDKSVEIERPDYKGNRLPTKILNKSAKILRFTLKNELTGTQKFSFELEDVLKQLYGHVTYMSILPQYFYSDFIMGVDKNLKIVPAPNNWIQHRWGEVKKIPDDKNAWLAVLPGGWNTLIRNTNQPLGSLNMKMRQLKILGFHPILVPYWLWRESTDKKSLVKNLVDSELKKIY